MGLIIQGLLWVGALFGSGIVRLIARGLLSFFAVKTVLIGVVTILLPIVLNNFFHDLIEEFLAFIETSTADVAGTSLAVEVSGLTAWLVDCFALPEVFSVLISAFSLHLFLKMIPFSPFR
jgi:hypothetical protein